jgi:NadR type nicotinamide-nucleotide adenylyltransferase
MDETKRYKILITGTESSGKTTLAGQLANHYSGSHVPDYARQYVAEKPAYEEKDLIKILKSQLELEEEIFSNAHRTCFCDTGPEVIRVWSQYKFGKSRHEIDESVLNMRYDLILLLKPDLKWEYDVLRENPENRDELHEMLKETLCWGNHNYIEIGGIGEGRLKLAISQVELLFSRNI